MSAGSRRAALPSTTPTRARPTSCRSGLRRTARRRGARGTEALRRRHLDLGRAGCRGAGVRPAL